MRRLVVFLLAVAAWHGGLAGAAEPLVVVLDTTQIMHLVKPAHRVIIGNPNIADVTLESPTLMYVVAKTPGETNLIVLDGDDKPILSRPVVVTSPPERTVSVHVPTNDGPTDRAYSCVANRCLRVPSPDAVTNGAGASAMTGNGPPGASAPSSPVPDALSPAAAGSGPR